MKIPNSFKNVIANNFYDKEIIIIKSNTLTDDEGDIISTKTEEVGSIKCNLNFSNCKKIKEDYGFNYDINIAITTTLENALNVKDIIKYQDKLYKITDKINYDSHSFLVGVYEI